MTIYEQIKEILSIRMNDIVTPSEVKNLLKLKYDTNPSSVILSDYCYNQYNKGISFNRHLFQYINKGSYKYLGEDHPYTGLIFHKVKGSDEEVIVGEWKNGEKTMYETNDELDMLSQHQIVKLYENYNDMLRNEMNLLHCKPTELRHLIGRIGEFLCAIHTNGTLARQVNQHGFDVVSNGRRISVKTTAQANGFIPINQHTFQAFDDLFVVQYVDDTFNVMFYGPKEEILAIAREYEGKYEVDLKRLEGISGKVRRTIL
ncbi:hypothetical protein D7Z54_29550 [Salibacterium salarium]|uniref:Uncharacterized protein n=1 Tax=Salibacterium salarium TaxID=284579 RepID=A0A428MUH3_9BACI|nr:hypothetical protein [Salibacterium salarium]RSL29778.1 hypothetical protein D7Z54_29550 [Salibacterium salarium]